MSKTRILLIGLLLAAPAAATAQGWQPDPNARRIAWGTANLVLRSDAAAGLLLWAGTSQALVENLPRRDFAARFEPDSVVNWLAYAQRVVSPPKGPTGEQTRLRTPDLLSIGGSSLALAREREGERWGDRVYVLFAGPEGNHPWSIAARPREAKEFLTSLFKAAGESSYDASVATLYAPNPVDSLTCPWPLGERPVDYPSIWARAGHGGDVWLTFVVKADSTVDPESVRVLVTDGVELTAAAVRAVTSVRYRPAQSHGSPRDALAFQRVSFIMKN